MKDDIKVTLPSFQKSHAEPKTMQILTENQAIKYKNTRNYKWQKNTSSSGTDSMTDANKPVEREC